MKYQIKAMLRTGGGAIVNMASVAGVHGVANLAGYVAGKAGIIGLTKVAALDYADQGIRVNVVAPRPILTHHLLAAGQEAQRQAEQATPMRRRWPTSRGGRRSRLAGSDGTSYITGATLPIDGGQSAGIKPPQFYRQGMPMSPPKEEESHERLNQSTCRRSCPTRFVGYTRRSHPGSGRPAMRSPPRSGTRASR